MAHSSATYIRTLPVPTRRDPRDTRRPLYGYYDNRGLVPPSLLALHTRSPPAKNAPVSTTIKQALEFPRLTFLLHGLLLLRHLRVQGVERSARGAISPKALIGFGSRRNRNRFSRKGVNCAWMDREVGVSAFLGIICLSTSGSSLQLKKWGAV